MEKIDKLYSLMKKNKILEEEYSKNLEKEKSNKEKLIQDNLVLQELKDFLFQVSANYREDLCTLFTSLVTEALTSIFEKDIKFNSIRIETNLPLT